MRTKLKAIGILGSLKPKDAGMSSNTEELLEQVFGELAKHDVETDVVRLIDHDIKHGLQTDMKDDWVGILNKIIEADIVVFATPIWWGQPSSLIQKVIERMDPPEMAAYWVGEAGPPMDHDAEKRRKNMATNMMVKTMSKNLYRYAKMIKENKAMLEEKI